MNEEGELCPEPQGQVTGCRQSRDLNTRNTKNTWQAIHTITGYSTSAGMDSIDIGHEKNSANVNEAAGPDNITQSPPLN